MNEDFVVIKQGKLIKKTKGSAGWDLESIEHVELYPGQKYLINTGLITSFDSSLVALIRDRSGLANKGLMVTGGVIDSDYDKEWKVIIRNNSQDIYVVKPGDRIAQVLFLRIPDIELYEQGGTYVEEYDIRTGGFGSTGI